MPILLMLALLAQAAEAPGEEEWMRWGAVCRVQAADPDNRFERTYRELREQANLPPRTVTRCLEPRGAAFAIMFSSQMLTGELTLIYNEEGERFYSDQAMRGLVAHELAHELLATTCLNLASDREQVACEAEVDQAAADLVGADALRRALLEFHQLYIRLMAESLARIRHRLDLRKGIMTGGAP